MLDFIDSFGIHKQHISVAHDREIDTGLVCGLISETTGNPEFWPFTVWHCIVIVKHGIACGCVIFCELVDIVTTNIVLVEQGTINPVKTDIRLCLTINVGGFTLIRIEFYTVRVTNLAVCSFCKWNFPYDIIAGRGHILTLIKKHLIERLAEAMCLWINYFLGIIAGDCIIVQIVFVHTLHLSITFAIWTESIAGSSLSNTCNHGPSHFFGYALYCSELTGRLHVIGHFFEISDKLVEYLRTVGQRINLYSSSARWIERECWITEHPCEIVVNNCSHHFGLTNHLAHVLIVFLFFGIVKLRWLRSLYEKVGELDSGILLFPCRIDSSSIGIGIVARPVRSWQEAAWIGLEVDIGVHDIGREHLVAICVTAHHWGIDAIERVVHLSLVRKDIVRVVLRRSINFQIVGAGG